MIRKTQVHTGDSELWREWRDMIRYGLGKPKQNNIKEELEVRVLSSCRPLSEGWPHCGLCPRSSTCHISWSDFSPGPRCYVPDPRRLESSCAGILLAIWCANLDFFAGDKFSPRFKHKPPVSAENEKWVAILCVKHAILRILAWWHKSRPDLETANE